MRRHLLFSIACVLVTSCGADQSTAPSDEPALPTDFAISITSGTTPTISWPGGLAEAFYVEEAPRADAVTASEMWSFGACENIFEASCTSSSGFGSPVQYGKLPAASTCGDPFTIVSTPIPPYVATGAQCPKAAALQRGTTYIIIVNRIDGRIGARYFTP